MRPPSSHRPVLAAWATVALALAVACDDGVERDADVGTPDGDSSAVILTTAVADTPTTSAPASATAATTASTATTATSGPPASPTVATTTQPPTMGDPVVTFETIATLVQPLDLAWRAGDPSLYVVEQAGRIVAVDPSTGATRVVLDVTDLTDAAGEQGLLGVAFAPSGELAYVNYTDGNGDTVVAELPVASDGTFDRAAQRVLLQVDQPYRNHNGGDLEIGPDGLLYIGLGDGGSAGDPERRALDTSTLLGKLLRIDPVPSGDAPYGVPADNPFVGVDGARPEIWSIGLRNPWKFTFDPLTRDLWVADVGQNQLEEVNHVPAPADGSIAGRGVSFGWSAFEGTERYNDDQPAEGHVGPVLTYRHGADGCSVSGGAPYRGSAIPTLSSGYVYGDYCSGRVWALDLAGARNVLLGTPGRVTAVVAGPDNELYVVSSAGQVRRIVPA